MSDPVTHWPTLLAVKYDCRHVTASCWSVCCGLYSKLGWISEKRTFHNYYPQLAWIELSIPSLSLCICYCFKMKLTWAVNTKVGRDTVYLKPWLWGQKVKGWVKVRLSVRTVCERRGSACRYDCTFLIGGFYRSYTLLVIGPTVS